MPTDAGIEPRTVATGALVVRKSKSEKQGVIKEIFYLGCPIAPSYTGPYTGEGGEGAGSQPKSTDVHNAQKLHVEPKQTLEIYITSYLTYEEKVQKWVRVCWYQR